jgi:hypothetical protein
LQTDRSWFSGQILIHKPSFVLDYAAFVRL